MRDFQSIHIKYGGQGVVPCSVSIGDTRETAEAYLSDVKVSYPIVLDQKAASKSLYGISGVPTTYMLSRDGIVRFRVLGHVGRDRQERMLKTLL
jgi:hypothetical protein